MTEDFFDFPNVFELIYTAFEPFFQIFVEVSTQIFIWGNVLLMGFFSYIAIKLYYASKNLYLEMNVVAQNTQYIKRRGVVGQFSYLILGIAFLFKLIPMLIVFLIGSNTPFISHILNIDHMFRDVNSLADLGGLELVPRFLVILISLFSLLSYIMIFYGIYLLTHRNLIDSDKNGGSYLVLGIALLFLCGPTTSLILIL